MLMDLILLFFTTRAKSFAAVLIYVYLWFVIVIIQSGIKWWHIVAVAITSVAIAWDRIILFLPGFSRSDAGEYSARSTELTTSLQLLKDYFPFGTGFGTFATDVAGNHYSPVYIRYGFCDSAQMSLVEGRLFYFFDDVFYPIIIGQTGIIGMVAFAFIIIVLVFLSMNMKKIDFRYYFSSVFIIGYLLVSSNAEPTFNNALSIPISLLFGMIIGWTDQRGADSEKKQG